MSSSCCFVAQSQAASEPADVEARAALPELAAVWWRRPVDERSLRRRELLSAAYTTVYCTPLVAAGALLIWIEPLLVGVSLIAWLHAWVIPELFAHRGARVLLPLPTGGERTSERVAQGFLGDLLRHDERTLQRETGLAMERGALGVWLV